VLGSPTGPAPDSAPLARRLHRPWPELEAFARSFDLATVDDVTHRHIPWGTAPASPGTLCSSMKLPSWRSCIAAVLTLPLDTLTLPLRAAVLLIQALAAWNEEHMGRLPATRDEKERFRALLRSWQRGGGGDGPALVRLRCSSAPPIGCAGRADRAAACMLRHDTHCSTWTLARYGRLGPMLGLQPLWGAGRGQLQRGAGACAQGLCAAHHPCAARHWHAFEGGSVHQLEAGAVGITGCVVCMPRARVHQMLETCGTRKCCTQMVTGGLCALSGASS